MAIKILKEGRNQDFVFVGSCSKCECLVQCDESDFQCDDRPCSDSYVPCPTPKCGQHILRSKMQPVPRD